MRYMMIIKSDETAEAGIMPPPEVFESMGRYNTELVDAGVLLAAEGLAPSKDGVKLTFDDAETTVTDGPYAEAKELIAGFWLIEVSSRDEAIEWGKRCPLGGGATLEVRRVAEASDFEGVVTPEIMEAEAKLRERTADRAGH